MKKQYKAPEIEILLFDFREIAMLEETKTGISQNQCIDDFIDENPWDTADDIDGALDNINEVTY